MNSNLVLYEKYTYEDVCRLLNWEKNIIPQNIGGYKYDDKTKTYPVFINYQKEEDVNDSIKYEDRFLDNSNLIAISKSKRKISSNDVDKLLKSEKYGIDIDLFIRKNKKDKEEKGKAFYYLGRIKAKENPEEITMPNTSYKAVEIPYKLITPVREDIYEYITS